MPSVCTVGNKPDAVPAVGRSDGTSRNNKRLDGITFSLKVAADGFDDLDVFLLIVAADVVGFAGDALRHDLDERPGVILDVEPVADLRTGAVNRQRLAVERMQNHQRNQFFREMVRAVVVGTVRHDGRQPESPPPCPHEMIARSLARRVGGRGSIRRSLAEEIPGALEIPVHFVGRDVVEPEPFFLRPVE